MHAQRRKRKTHEIRWCSWARRKVDHFTITLGGEHDASARITQKTIELVTLGSVSDVIKWLEIWISLFYTIGWSYVTSLTGFIATDHDFADRFNWERNEINVNTKFRGNHTAPMSSFKTLASRLMMKFTQATQTVVQVFTFAFSQN